MNFRSRGIRTAVPLAVAVLSAGLLGINEGDSIQELGPGQAGFLVHAP